MQVCYTNIDNKDSVVCFMVRFRFFPENCEV